MFFKKTFRYYWWVVIEFVRKHFKLISISFIVSFIFLIATLTISPYFEIILSQKKEVIGMVGDYTFSDLPEEVINKISNGLVFLNEEGDIIPLLINSWEKKDNGKRYRFHLKNNLVWDDGKKFEASDINYQFKDVSIKVIDNYTIEFNLDKPLAIFPIYLTKTLIRSPMIGIGGLYRATNIKTKNDNIITLTLLPQKKNLPILTYKFYKNETEMIIAYKKGEITKMKTLKKLVADQFSSWKNTKVTKIVDYSRLMTLFFNEERHFLKSKEIKQAIAMAIDFNKFTEAGEYAKGPIPPVSWAYNPDLKNPVYNPDAAEKIIKKEISATREAKLDLVTYYDYYDVADKLLEDFKKTGLKINLNIISYDKPNNFDFLLAFWKIPTDPDQYYFWHSTQNQSNIGNYKNVKIDKLLEDGRGTLSRNERKKIYYEFQRVMQDNPPALFLYYPYVYTIERR
ncbi:MAG: ABC transporter substrate-binding protein [Microgenomates group bacterium]